MTPTTEAPLTYEDYAVARDALAALADERAGVLKRNLDDLRRWLAAGAGERWLHYEAVVTRARDQDLALAMWWEYVWRRARNQRRCAEEKARRQAWPAPEAKAVEPVERPIQANTRIAAPRPIVAPAGAQRPAAAQTRSFSPTGQVWRR